MNLFEFFSPLGVILAVLGLAAVVATWLLLVRSWPLLPATLACHFDFLGRPDSFGPKRGLWVLPVLVAALYVTASGLGLWGVSQGGDTVERLQLNLECLMGLTAYSTWMIFFLARRTIEVALNRRKDIGRWSCLAILAGLALLIFAGSLRLR